LSPALGVYVHWPYCTRICPYCDFNVLKDRGATDEKAALADAIIADLSGQATLLGPRRLTSIFFGGGTPSLMDPRVVARIIDAATRLWAPEPGLEITLEANPTDAETGRFTDLARAGVNRLSLGLQSLDDGDLRVLGRNHDAATARRAAERAVAVFRRVSVDMIYALPGQWPDDWAKALSAAASLGAEHISPYQLTIEPGTAFARAVQRRTLIPPADDLAADLFDTTQAVLGSLGFEAYEVSNHARGEAARSRHNLIYWRGDDYVGAGPGAHGRLTLAFGRHATIAPRAVGDYVQAVTRKGYSATPELLTAREVAVERLLMGLRTVEGVSTDDLAPLNIPAQRIDQFQGLAEIHQGRFVATARGRPVLDRIIAELADAR
jgi:oxygen-independent coproporphyrinogen-3 oxidase